MIGFLGVFNIWFQNERCPGLSELHFAYSGKCVMRYAPGDVVMVRYSVLLNKIEIYDNSNLLLSFGSSAN